MTVNGLGMSPREEHLASDNCRVLGLGCRVRRLSAGLSLTRTLAVCLLVLGVALSGCGSSSGSDSATMASAHTTGSAQPAAMSAHQTFFAQTGAARIRVVRPHRLLVSGDGSLFVKKMTWTHWGSLKAHGRGTSAVNRCRPDCAHGTYRFDPVVVTLARARHRCGHWFFTRLVLHYPAGHPKFFKATESFPFRVFC